VIVTNRAVYEPFSRFLLFKDPHYSLRYCGYVLKLCCASADKSVNLISRSIDGYNYFLMVFQSCKLLFITSPHDTAIITFTRLSTPSFIKLSS